MSTTTDLAAARYVRPETATAAFDSQISCGGSRAVSIHLRQFFDAIRQYWEFKIESFPVCIRHHMQQRSFVLHFSANCQAVRERRPVRLGRNGILIRRTCWL